jgi:hypothetical protein
MDRKLELLELTVIRGQGQARDNKWTTMLQVLDPFRFVLIAVAGWMNQWEYQMIDYLREENRVLREQLGHMSMSHEGAQFKLTIADKSEELP